MKKIKIGYTLYEKKTKAVNDLKAMENS